MNLRPYLPEDAAVICSWITDRDTLYRWSADRIGIFPLHPQDLNDQYVPRLSDPRFIPLTACDENGSIVGHLFIRHPLPEDDSIARFGFVIVDPKKRGKGYGSAMIRAAIGYVRDHLTAGKITLGVFANNPPAFHCYRACGFRETGQRDSCSLPDGNVWDCIEMEMPLIRK